MITFENINWWIVGSIVFLISVVGNLIRVYNLRMEED